MMTATLATEASVASIDRRQARRRERVFYIGMGLALFIPVLISFTPSLYLRPIFARPPLTRLVYFHGVVFTLWLVLFLLQSILVAAHRVRLHISLGLASIAIAVLMVVLGAETAIAQGARGRDTPDGGPIKGMIIPLTDMVMFSGLYAAGFHYRKRPETHKRLMLLASIGILPGATARLPFAFITWGGPPAYFAIADLFLIPCLLYDWYAHRRLHPATIAGAFALGASQVLRLWIGGTHAWMEFGGWLTQWMV